MNERSVGHEKRICVAVLRIDELSPELREKLISYIRPSPVAVIGSSDSPEIGDSFADLFLGVSSFPIRTCYIQFTRPNRDGYMFNGL